MKCNSLLRVSLFTLFVITKISLTYCSDNKSTQAPDTFNSLMPVDTLSVKPEIKNTTRSTTAGIIFYQDNDALQNRFWGIRLPLSGKGLNGVSNGLDITFLSGFTRMQRLRKADLKTEKNGICLGLAASFADHINGINIAVGFGGARTLNGVTICGLANGGEKVNGIMLAGLANDCSYLNGISLAAFQMIEKSVKGAELGLVNIGAVITGAQSGLLNLADSLRGVQFGIYNVAEDMKGIQIGLWNTHKAKDGKNKSLPFVYIHF